MPPSTLAPSIEDDWVFTLSDGVKSIAPKVTALALTKNRAAAGNQQVMGSRGQINKVYGRRAWELTVTFQIERGGTGNIEILRYWQEQGTNPSATVQKEDGPPSEDNPEETFLVFIPELPVIDADASSEDVAVVSMTFPVDFSVEPAYRTSA